MAVSAKHRGWLTKLNEGILAAVYNGAMPGTTAHGANTALDGVLLGTPVTPALAVDSLVISNLVASGDIALVANNGGNSQAWLVVDASVPSMTFYASGVVEQTLTSTGVVFNEGSADKDFRVEGNGIEYALYVDGGKDSVVIGSNTDTSSADNRVVISRAARTATADTSYYDLYVAPAGAVTVPNGSTSAVVASVALNEPNVTATGTVTTAATLYLASQPTEGGANGALVVADDAWIGLGTNADQVLVNRSTILNTNTALTGVLLGTPVTPAIAANSLVVSNITASGDILVAANVGGNSQAWLWVDSSAGTMTLYGAGTAVGVISAAALEIEDDILLALGNDQDVVLVNRSSILNANTALTGTLIGTPVTPAVAANSLILANATASGDILVAVNEGGNSQAYLWIDTSAAEMRLYGSGTLNAILTSGTVNIEDDILLGIGTGSTARFSYDTTDANSNQLLLQLPAAGATDSPVLIVGQSIESVDFGAAATGADYSAITDPRIAIFSSGAVTTGPVVEFRKARGTTAAPTVVTTGDDLGTLDFYGAVANGEYVQAASIRADMAGTIASTRGPGTLTFLTATDALPSVLTAALTISAAQLVTCAAGVTVTTGDVTISSGNLAFSAASDITIPAATAAALEVSDGTTKFYAVDTRVATAGATTHTLSISAYTIASGAGNVATALSLAAHTLNYTGTTQVTSEVVTASLGARTIASDGVLTVDKASTLKLQAPIESTNVTLTVTSALRIATTTGTPTNQYGVYIETLSGGTTANRGIYLAGANGIEFGAADDIIMLAATAAALEISDGTTKFYAFDTRVTTVGVTTHALDISDYTFASAAGAVATGLSLAAHTLNLTGNTQVTTQVDTVVLGARTIAADGVGGACTVDEANTLLVVAPTEGTNAVITAAAGLRVLNAGGTPVTQYGIYIEDLTSGATSDYGIVIAGADTAAIYVPSADPILLGLATAGTGRLQFAGTTSGVVTLTVGAAAGTWTMTLPAAVGGAGEQLTDAAANGITSWAAAASSRELKDIQGTVTPEDGLKAILGTPVYQFRYKDGAAHTTGDYRTDYVGVLADEAPWAMHYDGKIVNPVNALGYSVLGIQALYDRIHELEQKVAGLAA